MGEHAAGVVAGAEDRRRARLRPIFSWVLVALCCLFLLFYLAAQGRAIVLMLRGFAPDDSLEALSARGGRTVSETV